MTLFRIAGSYLVINKYVNIIQLLPDSIANQIAAGEVVQRPASVVKELLENSVDAGAKAIQLVVRDAGRTLIQVIDDGSGMTETDARMSFERHATSKIRTSDDLFRIRTMGFRGEALASIAAVSQVELRTRRAEEELGTLIRIEGSELKTQEAISCLPGTNLLIKNLFFNVPARRNFLKSNSVEMRHIIDEFQRVALANPEVSFTLYQDDREVFNLPAGKLSRRIIDTFGKSYREQLAYCEEETPYVKVRGYIGKPESAKKTRNEQFFFVNLRYIKHNYLHHAVVGAYEGTLPEGSHPFYVLFIDIDPSHIDINIHPTKTEIKFDDERSVYAIMMAAVRRAVGVYNLSPSLDFDANVNFLSGQGSLLDRSSSDNNPSAPRPVMPSWMTGIANPGADNADNSRDRNKSLPTNYNFDKSPSDKKDTDQVRQGAAINWQALFEGVSNVEPSTDKQPPADWLPPATESIEVSGGPPAITFGSRANQLTDNEEVAVENVVQVHNRYLLATMKSGLLVIDQRRAYERILYEQFHGALSRQSGVSQQLLFPKTVSLMPADYQLAIELRSELTNLGFQFDELGANTLVIRGVPALSLGLVTEKEEELFANLLAQLREDTGKLKLDRTEALARSLARRTSVRYQARLTSVECKALIDQLFASSNPSYTPSGEPVTTVLTLDKIAGLFKP